MSQKDEPMHVIYEKNGVTQVAASPRREVELKFAGWRRRDESAPPATAAGGDATPSDPTPGTGDAPASGGRSKKPTPK